MKLNLVAALNLDEALEKFLQKTARKLGENASASIEAKMPEWIDALKARIAQALDLDPADMDDEALTAVATEKGQELVQMIFGAIWSALDDINPDDTDAPVPAL